MLFKLTLAGRPNNPKFVDVPNRDTLEALIGNFGLHGYVETITGLKDDDDNPAVITISDEGKPFNKNDSKIVRMWIRESLCATNPSNNVYRLHSNLEDDYLVDLNGKPFDPKPSLEHVNHSPDGFSFGYTGSGPAQLAFAVLLNETGDLELTYRRYQEFKFDFLAHIKTTPFVFTSDDVRKYLLAITDCNYDDFRASRLENWRKGVVASQTK